MINGIYRMAGNMLSPGGERARLCILIYHRVLREHDPLFPSEPTAEFFDAQLNELKKTFNVLPLGEAVDRMMTKSLPPRAACITFDDGYADNAEVALPILQRHGLHATFFIATAYLNGGRMFNDTIIHAIRHSHHQQIDLSDLGLGVHDLTTTEAKRKALGVILSKVRYLPLGQREACAEELCRLLSDASPPLDLMMTTHQLQNLRDAGMEIGGHTARHPILSRLSQREATDEVAEGKEYLESSLNIKVTLFAYPNGQPIVDYLPDQIEIPKKLGFKAAVSTQWGTAHSEDDRYQLPRYTPYCENISRFTPMLLQNLMRRYG